MEQDTKQEKAFERVKEHCQLCGKCNAATFMVWDCQDIKTEHDTPPGMARIGKKLGYVVRCDYFKITVKAPYLLQGCEAFREARPNSSNDET